MSEEKFVTRSECVLNTKTIQSNFKLVELTIKELSKDMEDMKKDIKYIRKVLIESNGGESIVSTVRKNSEAIKQLTKIVADITDHIKKEQEEEASKFKKIADASWKYAIRFVSFTSIIGVILILATILSGIFGDPEKLKLIFEVLKKGVM